MFVHTGENLPKEPNYEPDLAKLGFKVDENNCIIGKHDSKPFLFFHSSNERANELRKEAMHEAVREVVKDQLKMLWVNVVYVGGEDGKDVFKSKPKGKHIQIFATELEELKKKHDVIIMIGDPNEYPGIWAWRHLLGAGGIDGGSAVGLVKKLATLGLDSTGGEPAKDIEGSKTGPQDSSNTPGIIILNPGAQVYSHKENVVMSILSWLNRKRKHGLGEAYRINEEVNFVKGHTTPFTHMETCLESILPQIIANDAELYIVGVTHSAEHFIKWYQSRQCTVGTPHSAHYDVPGIHSNISAMALIEPTHDASKIKCQAVEWMLAEYGRQYFRSNSPLGTLLAVPMAIPKTPNMPSLPARAKGSELRLPDYAAANPTAQSEKPELDQSIVELDSTSNASASNTTGIEDEFESISLATTLDDAENLTKSQKTDVKFELQNEEGETEEAWIDCDDGPACVNCATYSGGEPEITELLWPNAMDRVLDHFKFMAERTAQQARLAQ